MTKLRGFLLLLISIPVFILLLWLVALPDSIIKTTIEDFISNNAGHNITASINGLKKGVFFTLYADNFELKKEKTTLNEPSAILRITDISAKINPLYLLKKQLAFSVRAKMGTGDIEGSFKLPVGTTRFREGSSLKIERAEINAIPHLQAVGFKGSGLISANLNLKNNIVDITFETSNAEINNLARGLPLPLNSFQAIQGALQFEGNTIKVTSISLEGDKGYARLKGDINNGVMNLTLELMPLTDKLKPVEMMLISRYQISPGYYVVPIEGPLL